MKDIFVIFNIFPQKQKRVCAILIFLMVLGGGLESIGIGAILPLISIMQQSNYLDSHPQLLEYCAWFGVNDDIELIVSASIILIALYFIKNVYIILQLTFQRNFVRDNQIIYMKELLATYFQKEYLFHVSNNSVNILRNITVGGTSIFFNYLMSVLSLISEIITAICIWGMLIFVDPFSAIVVAGIMGFMIYTILLGCRKYVEKQGIMQNKATSVYMKWVNQGLGAIKETKVMGKENFFLTEFEKSYSDYVEAINKYSLAQAIPRSIIEFLVVIGLLLLIIVKLFLGYSPFEIVGVLGLLALSAFRLMPSANRIVSYCNAIKNYMPLLKEMYPDLLEVKKRLIGKKVVFYDDNISKMILNVAIDIDDIVFSYPDEDKNVLKGVSFSIPKGSFVGIVGHSGAGKTTFVDILLGLLKPKSGTIKCDGIDIYQNIRAWQKNISYVPQDIYLLDGTIKENIALGIKNDQIDIKYLYDVLKKAELYDFVINMPNGLDTVIGERGVMLSGGQRQRIGIARALYRKPNILVLDEATSALDTDTEKSITDTILKLKGIITIISIAHRVSTLEQCDFKVELKEGEAYVRL